MADLLSNLYLGHSVRWYQNNFKISDSLTNYCINRLADENQIIINRVIDNSGLMKPLLLHMKKSIKSTSYENNRNLIKEVINNEKIMNEIKKDVYTKNTVLEELEKLSSLDNDSTEYKQLLDKVIQVAEFKN